MNIENILIRKVEQEDAEGYILLKDLVWRVAYKHIFPEEVFIDMENRREERIKKFKDDYHNDNTKMCYVAENNGEIIGLIYGKIISMYDYFAEREFADLMALYIKPEYQGSGIASKFRNIFIDWAKENGATKYVIGVLKENTNARKVYEKWGGKLDSHEQLFYRLGVGYDEVFYTYDL